MDQLANNSKPLVRTAWRLFYLSHRAWSQPIEQAGLTTSSFPVLEMIVQNPGITQQEITDQVSLDKSCTSRACKALEALQELGLSFPVFGMVKDDRHRTRALVTPEGAELGISQSPHIFALIGRIQEETHRFAITYHHESHTKNAMKSALDDISGVGPKRKEALRKHFGTIKAIREADVETLSAVIPRSAAEAVWNHFHK